MSTFTFTHTLPSERLVVNSGPGGSFQMNASTTEPTKDVSLTIPHSELSTGKTVSLLADGSDTGQDFVDSTTNSRYSLTYTPSASIGSEVDLKAEVDGSGAQSNVVTITIEEGPGDFSSLSGSAADATIQLDWTYPSVQENDLKLAEIHRAEQSINPEIGDSTKVAGVTGPQSGQTDSFIDWQGEVLLEGTYYYTILVKDDDGFVGSSNEISLTVTAEGPGDYAIDFNGNIDWEGAAVPTNYSIDKQGNLDWS